ncbi:putative transcriptional regulator [Caldisphaera lagunensis DSM 15908]|uniref:Putative transcriptional regulator n=1 Tax=Caldisphaera lagunensis (strain DSM 15908 / JCM 11604 / ANMR 0165 / IC-154) TaxID=1056495 RepID=L0A8E8_CALLD|nr:PadR family transcriptional regulator [Caldisphaera lagunensis]AFZ70128.1 putative transcriptional regulator [Caldisphaera lagunensis DSM 15908]
MSFWEWRRRSQPRWAKAWRHRGWLRPMIISLLYKKPLNGVELMNEIELLTNGIWRPSPGSLYPIINELISEGLVFKNQYGKYELTNEGKEFAKATLTAFYLSPDPNYIIDRITDLLNFLESLEKENREIIKSNKDKLISIKNKIENILRYTDSS